MIFENLQSSQRCRKRNGRTEVHPTVARCLFFITLALSSAHAASPVTQEWKDAKGATFKGEPVEALGPLAMFRTGATSSRFLPMHILSPDDCLRFHHAIAHRAPRAEKWSEAKGEASRECIGRLQHTEKDRLVPFDFSKVPEPELLLGVFAGKRLPDVESPQFLVENLAPFVTRVRRVYPGRLGTIAWAARDSHVNMKSLPGAARDWLTLDPQKGSGVKALARFIPAQGISVVLMTREGVPLHGTQVHTIGDVAKFVDGASNILWELNPANPRSARDRLHYLSVVRPMQFATGVAEALLLIDPLKVDVLRQRDVKSIAAKCEIGVDGRIREVELLPSSEMPEPLRPAITEALRRNMIFLPAIENGTPVASHYDYALKIGPLVPELATDLAWVNGEARHDVPFKSWLVLKSIKVSEQVFSKVLAVGVDGTVMMSAVTAGDSKKISTTSQLNAFNDDFFDKNPLSVRPVAGQKQEVFGEPFAWKMLKPEDGLVDFLESRQSGSLDFCVGYAWTEIELPNDMDAWLGFGSDDGVKVWVNGDLVNDRWIQRRSLLDDEVIPLRLKKGKNAFLVKIQNVRGRWSFTARLRVRGS
jgi:hypothetical protein